MKKLSMLVVMILGLVLILSFGVSAGKIYIDRINGVDSALVNEAKMQLTNWINSTGHTPTTVKDEADYLIRFNVISAESERNFNWIVLFVPAWPFVPVTTPKADVMISVTILTNDGREVFGNQTGDKASAWLLGDFISVASLKEKAFHKAFSKLLMSANF